MPRTITEDDRPTRELNTSAHTPTALDLLCHDCPLPECNMGNRRCLLRRACNIPDDVTRSRAEPLILTATRAAAREGAR